MAASALVALFTLDAFSDRALLYLADHQGRLIVSDFGAAQFASALSRRVRMKELSVEEARHAFSVFDEFCMRRAAQRVETTTWDVKATERFLRRLDLPLRTADALNIAIAQRLGASLLTFDVKMAAAAEALGLDVPRA